MADKRKENIEQYKKEAIIEGLQQPSVLVSASVFLLSLGYTVALAPFIGGALVGLGIAGISGVSTGGLIAWNCFFNNEKYLTQKYEEDQQRIKLLKEQNDLEAIDKNERVLAKGLLETKLVRGIKEFKELKKEYSSVVAAFSSSRADNALIDINKIKEKSREVYLQGLDVLLKSVEIARQVIVTDCENLEKENEEIRADITEHEKNNSPATSQKERLAQNEKVIKTIDISCNRIDELLNQSDLCESLLRTTRLALPELVAHQSKDDAEKIMTELSTRIEIAQKLREKYNTRGV